MDYCVREEKLMFTQCQIKVTLHQPGTDEPIDVWTFENRSYIKIGRAADNDVILANSLVSRRHIELKYAFSLWKLENVGANGIFLDGQQVELGWVRTNGTEIRVGQSGPILKLWPDTSQEPVIDVPNCLEEPTLYEQPFAL